MVTDALPEGWVRWNEEPEGRLILAYRPDVFDSSAFPAPCLPTLYVSNGPHRNRRPEQRAEGYRSECWYVTFYLEPDVSLAEERYDDRAGAVEGALSLAERFSNGTIAYREAYRVPRESYLDRLDELTERER
ncbi:DUF5820 family protein [Natronorarus salvus]|uniref:DUF5820 family protein n=1 Tax=Natronorarus salvus TaxID=3117733 RepID=UPI002F268B6C